MKPVQSRRRRFLQQAAIVAVVAPLAYFLPVNAAFLLARLVGGRCC